MKRPLPTKILFKNAATGVAGSSADAGRPVRQPVQADAAAIRGPRQARKPDVRFFPQSLVRMVVQMVACAAAATAQAQPTSILGEAWPTDRIVLDDGRSFAGLLESEQHGIVNFVEVRRPAGKPMFLIVHPIERGQITELHRLDKAAREVLRRRLHAYRNRARIEAGRADAVRLHSRHIDGVPWWEYNAGKWFQLRTTLDESRARRVVVRLRQVFQAYRQVFPAEQTLPLRPLTIIVHGRKNQYLEALRSEGVEFDNPALFEPAKNRVVAGCTLNELVDRIRAAREEHDEVERQLREWNREFVQQAEKRDRDLQKQGMPATERSKIASAMRRRWNQQLRETQQTIARAERQNQQLVGDETDALLRLLYHEALHAYLDNAVYDRDVSEIPSWLNEGLAQIFEAARIEADLMRIDAPDPIRLAMLKQELGRADRLTLNALLNARHDRFLAMHGSDAADSDRHYLCAWGLVYYLAFDRQLVGSRSMQVFIARAGESGSPVKRFEEFVGMPLAEFEPQWIEAMQSRGSDGMLE